MSLNAVKILGTKITISSKKEILEELEKFIVSRPSSGKNILTVVTPNPEQIVYAARHAHVAKLINRADVAIPDGVGIVWASCLINNSAIPKRIPGVEFMEDLVSIAAKRAIPVALIGGRGDVAVEAFECLSRRMQGLKGVGIPAPSMQVVQGELKAEQKDNLDTYFSAVTRTIALNGVKIVFVGLGAPKQELFIERLCREMSLRDRSYGEAISKISERLPRFARNDNMVIMSVGGSFDIITGRTPRAPVWVRNLGLEWFWRLIREPWRLGRQLALLKFVWLVVRERWSGK